ncbi:MAG: tetratricopeptide repeat protein [Deltaproteobacteria bacterium]|nr:tetratricopeptide repeat protein [Deltaproteobacteria bacterium]
MKRRFVYRRFAAAVAFATSGSFFFAGCVSEERKEIARANVLYNQGAKDPAKLEESLRLYRRITEKNPGSIEAQLAFGQVLFDLGCYDHALLRFDAALAAQAESPPALVGRGAALMFLKRWDDAATTYRRLLVLDKENLNYANNLGKAVYFKGDYGAAETTFNKVLAAKKDDRTARFFLGEIALKKGDTAAAAREFERLNELEPGRFFGPYGLAKVALASGKVDEAIDKLRLAFSRGIEDVAGVREDPAMSKLLDDDRVKKLIAEAANKRGAITNREFRAAPVCEVVLPRAR